ncbi:MAG: N-methyl-L-tryptophan oxidase [Actinobacteria bacterium]|nr:MAG: N-methyl-L-tryptophan oxidase [Actinomycetota bacterium]
MEEFDAIVVGLGALGSAAACRLAARGSVLGLEQFELGHDRGASQDHSRIIRLSYHTPGYVRLAKRAYEAWAEIERDAGEPLIVRTGGLDLWPADAAIPMTDYTESLTAEQVPFERLDAAEVMRSWPQWSLDDDTLAIFQEDAGIAPAARCNEAHRRLATELGAVLRPNSPVTAIHASTGEVEVEAPDARFRTHRLILTADAWTNDLLSNLGVHLPLTTTQEQVTYFAAPHADDFATERFPIWIWMDEPSFYGFPAYGHPGPKVAQDCGGLPVTPSTRTFEPDPDNLARVTTFVNRHLPSALGPIIETKTCLYTLTPDRDFVIDVVPGHPEVLVALGAAHAFKFAALIGRALDDLATDGATDLDLSPFRIDRPILQLDDPPTSWMI